MPLVYVCFEQEWEDIRFHRAMTDEEKARRWKQEGAKDKNWTRQYEAVFLED
jgi:hypothetical protein